MIRTRRSFAFLPAFGLSLAAVYAAALVSAASGWPACCYRSRGRGCST
jgi:hypothetical protein